MSKFLLIFMCSFFFVIQTSAQKKKRIVIDPGHGICHCKEHKKKGKCDKVKHKLSRTHEEVETNLLVSLKLKKLLEACNLAIRMTRDKLNHEAYYDLAARARSATSNGFNAKLFLSIHCNAGGGNGTETFWCDYKTKHLKSSVKFSKIVHRNISSIKGWNGRRVVEDSSYLHKKEKKTGVKKYFHLGVLKTLKTSGTLSEIGFVDNPKNLKKLLNSKWQDKFALAYYNAIHEFLDLECHTVKP